MTAQQLLAFDECLKQGSDFIRRCGATFEIAIKAFTQLASKEKSRLEANRKEDERLKAIAAESRAKQERDALRQKQIFDVKKRKSDAEKLSVEAAKRKLEIDRLVKEAEKDLISLMNEEDMANNESIRGQGERIRSTHEKKQLLKREEQSIRAGNKSLAKALK